MSQEGMNWGGITGHRSGIKDESGFVQVSFEWMAQERSAREEEEEYLEYSKGVSFIIIFFFSFSSSSFFDYTFFPSVAFRFFFCCSAVCALHQVFPESCVTRLFIYLPSHPLVSCFSRTL